MRSGKDVSRRSFLVGGAGAVAALGLAACGSSSSGSTKGSGGSGNYGHGTFTYADWGGTSDTGFRTAVGKAFTNKSGWEYQTVVPISYAKFASQVKSHNVQWDGMDAEGYFPYLQPETLAKMDYSKLGITKDDMLYPEFWVPQANAIANYSTSFVIGHRSDKKGPIPQSWQEFFDPSLPGRRMIYNYPYGMLELALLGDGVSYGELYPLDVNRGLKKLKAMGSSLTYWNAAAQAQQALVSGTADFVVTWNNRIGYLGISGMPVGIVWNEHIHSNGMHIIPRGDPREKMCYVYIQTALSGPVQAALAQAAGFAPTTKAGQAALDQSIVPWMNTTPQNWNKGLGIINDEWWGKNWDAVYSKWTAAIQA